MGSSAGNRNDFDFYPTPPDVTRALLDYLKLPQGSRIWEPACGDGAISRVLEDAGHIVESSDIRIEGIYGECGFDFLTAIADDRRANIVITNPPFCLAEEFIYKCAYTFKMPLFAMLLKSQYFHAMSRLPMFRECPPSAVLALSWRVCFRPQLKTGGTMEFSWFVWDSAQPDITIYDVLERPNMSGQGDLFAEPSDAEAGEVAA